MGNNCPRFKLTIRAILFAPCPEVGYILEMDDINLRAVFFQFIRAVPWTIVCFCVLWPFISWCEWYKKNKYLFIANAWMISCWVGVYLACLVPSNIHSLTCTTEQIIIKGFIFGYVWFFLILSFNLSQKLFLKFKTPKI